MRTTHYIPAFTYRKGDIALAWCGAIIRVDAHSTEPTCETCKSKLLAEPETVAEAFGTGEDDRPDPIKPDTDPVAEYEERMDRRYRGLK